ncbi:hypothetical protein WCE19_00650 [Enterobacter cloacae]|nr:hypothetical protein [Enterobacter cloacae]MDU2669344.1 hypothetical protein [Enterobacter cloacae]MEA5221310.1 hypothetical protein [Enterobacter cloacae]
MFHRIRITKRPARSLAELFAGTPAISRESRYGAQAAQGLS